MQPAALVVLLASIASQADTSSWPCPKVVGFTAEFERPLENFKTGQDVREGYVLDEATSIASGRWVVGILKYVRQHREDHGFFDFPPADRRVRTVHRGVAAVAVEVRTGRVSVLRLPASLGTNPAAFGFDIAEVFALGGSRCGVSLRRLAPAAEGPTAYSDVRVLWEWDPGRGTIRQVGEWVPLGKVAEVIDMTRSSLDWRRPLDGSWDGKFRVIDLKSGRHAEVKLDPQRLVGSQIEGGLAFSPAAGAGAFVACDVSDDPESDLTRVACFDPNIGSGVRWSLTGRQLNTALGGDVVSVTLPGGHHRSPTVLPLIVGTVENPGPPVSLVFVGTRSGAVERVTPIPGLFSAPLVASISPDHRLLVYEGAADTWPLPLKLLDCESGDVLDTFSPDEIGDVDLIGISREEELLVKTSRSILALSLRPQTRWTVRPIFALGRPQE